MRMRNFLVAAVAAVALAFSGSAWAEEVTYQVKAFNDDAQAFVIQAWGEQPQGAVADFWNDFGAVRGNRYNQIPRTREARLYLQGFEGCTIKSVTLSMCSNNSSGSLAMKVSENGNELFAQKAADFNSESWYGEWVSKDLGMYVEVTKPMTATAVVSGDVEVLLTGGTSEGSVYVNAVTVEYDRGTVATESPMGWVYEKVAAKGTLNAGDVIILYRSGDAAGDIDGMATSHYLDAIGVTSTSCVVEPDVARFTLGRDAADSHWTLTNQHGKLLGARGAKDLAWDEGETTWDITLGYDGATVASTKSSCGTLRYNVPSGGYPRFWNYTSTSLTLPYIYRRVRQLDPVVSTSLTLPYAEREVALGSQDTLVVKASLLPATVTDQRIRWASSDERVATVRDGIVHPLAVGTCLITATAADGGSSATLTLTVKPAALVGDLNGDGVVNAADVSEATNVVLEGGFAAAADINGDGVVSAADISALINLILAQ